jgi:hypothetical protein
MMSTRRSLFGTGCLMAALVLFGSTAVIAQTVAGTPGDDFPPAVEMDSLDVDGTDYNEVSVEWVWEQKTLSANRHDNDTVSDESDDYPRARGFLVRWVEGTDTGSIQDADVIDTRVVDLNADPPADDSYLITIDGLEPNTPYVVGVTSLGAGTRPDSDEETVASGTTHPADEPDDVRNLMLTPGDRMIMASWDVTTDNGSPVTAYHVQIKVSGEEDDDYEVVRLKAVGGTSTEWNISNLTNGTEYTVRVRAYSYTVPGDYSDEAMATPAVPEPEVEPPSRPTAVKVEAGDGMLTVTWDKPDLPGTSAITGYGVFYRQAGGVWSRNPVGADPLERMATIEGLANGVAHEVRVHAMNEAAGYSPASEIVTVTPMEGAGEEDEDDPMPTPALPIFGAMALGAGLLAAGRARLRNRRALSSGRVRRQLSR